jgi:glycosyltransferase involved in cell wall biosynthesis
VDLPKETRPLPRRFTVGYLGAYGPDKGVRYLLAAWKQLNYKDAVLRLAGRDSTCAWVRSLVRNVGGGAVELVGWVDDVADFYGSLSLYVQPSATEGFGIEVLEAMAHGRAVLCSSGAGAADVTGSEHQRFTARDVDELAGLIDDARTIYSLPDYGEQNRELAANYSWDKIRARYAELWEGML